MEYTKENNYTKYSEKAYEIFTWEQIRTAVTTNNRLMIKKIGTSLDKPILVQEGVTVEEAKAQILAMAPGNHPHLGPILLDLAEKMKSNEWH